MLCIGAFFAIV